MFCADSGAQTKGVNLIKRRQAVKVSWVVACGLRNIGLDARWPYTATAAQHTQPLRMTPQSPLGQWRSGPVA